MSPAFLAMLSVLKVTASNVRSLGPAGALEPFEPYRIWLAEIDRAIGLAEAEIDRRPA
jgi:hypothetical protein